MKQAASAARQGKPQAAQRQGKQAQQQLETMEQQLDQQREGMQEEWKAEVVAAIDRMMAETSRLADRQLAISEALRAGEAPSTFRAQQAAVEEGVEKLAEQYRQVSGENALVPPQIGATLEAARRQMAESQGGALHLRAGPAGGRGARRRGGRRPQRRGLPDGARAGRRVGRGLRFGDGRGDGPHEPDGPAAGGH